MCEFTLDYLGDRYYNVCIINKFKNNKSKSYE